MSCLWRGCREGSHAHLKPQPSHTRCVKVKRADSREADRCCWWPQQSARISPKGFTVHHISIAPTVGMRVQEAGQECVLSALRDIPAVEWGEKCIYSVQPGGGNSTLTSLTFLEVPFWQRSPVTVSRCSYSPAAQQIHCWHWTTSKQVGIWSILTTSRP